ncbi:hypothetical protein HCN44_005064 [Aphidius gifuensis]|uniref:HMG box domain-containing protein n=1 Tax=Aphidius gifuensis TaxID=684658 RepID=A0A835CTW1_APHGI|nr:hypothetical protein HCN44_005064 [Aphidius gifuensis]
MVEIDWDRIRAVKAVSLADEEIENLFPIVIKCDIETIDDIHDLRAIMKLSQEMLQYKDNQVESLLLECDELKEKITTVISTSPKKEDEIEEDNNDKEVKDSPDIQFLEESIRMKNDKIKTLMLELESIESENLNLKMKLETLKEEIEDATENMNDMTDELQSLRSKNILNTDEINQLKQEKIALLAQTDELANQQIDRDKIIDEFGAAIDVRVSEWQNILENKNAEILHLKEEYSRLQMHPNLKLQDNDFTTQIANLNEEIETRDKIILEFESKISEATIELNESATLIEQLKADAKKLEKSGKRKEQRDLLRKVQEANEKIVVLQDNLKQTEDNLTVKSQQLCEVLNTLKKYENKDQGLTDTINEVKHLKVQLSSKNQHIQDLVNVINKLEALNSHQDMQIAAFREKLGMTDEEEISIDGVSSKHQEEIRIKNQLLLNNASLEQENLDLKADIRTLRYKLTKLGEKVITARDKTDSRVKPYQSDRSNINWVAEQEIISMRHNAEIDELQKNAQIVIEENEALRKGMHEILDSIRDQDGKSIVDVQSDTLEKLLEALDVRHLAGWYHPAMRLQGRLSVVQGSNNELRLQLKQIKKEMQKKDDLLRRVALKKDSKNEKINSEISESENEDVKTIVTEMQRIQAVYRDELAQWELERETLSHEKNKLNEENEKLLVQLNIYEKDLKAIESGDEETQKALVERSKECAESIVNLIIATRKCTAVEALLTQESSKYYNIQKEAIAAESTYKKIIADMDKRNKLLENKNRALESNLSNSISILEYNELKEKFDEASIRIRSSYELKLAATINEELEKYEDKENTRKNIYATNLELQKQLAHVQNYFIQNTKHMNEKNNEEINNTELLEEIKKLKIENEYLTKTLTISREEAQMYYTTNSLKTLELDNLRHQVLDLQAISEDKETIAKLGFELNNCKAAEIEINRKKIQLDSEILQLQSDLDTANKKYDEAKIQLKEFHRHCDNRFKNYEEVIEFLQTQYAGSTSMTSLERYENMLQSLMTDRNEISANLKNAKKSSESANIQQETLTNRLEIVERLKDILEQQIGSPDVQSIMNRFSENSQKDLNEYRFKRRITQLENELKITANKLNEYESTISAMEYDMVNIQKLWRINKENPSLPIVQKQHVESKKIIKPDLKSVFVEARVECHSVEVQSDPVEYFPPSVPEIVPEKIIITTSNGSIELDEKIIFLQDQLKQALMLASDRSSKLIKWESLTAEYKAKINALDKVIAEKDTQLVEQIKLLSEQQLETSGSSEKMDVERTDKVAFKSTINSLQKLITQKEETIMRYQTLLKEDRDEHSKAAGRFQEEIKNLRIEISLLKDDLEKKNALTNQVTEGETSRMAVEKIFDEAKETRRVMEVEEKLTRMNERVSTLEADLNISQELGERWRRLAEERLQHMDEMREKLEAQHKNELESYRAELDKWQSESSALRQRLSENRMKLNKGNLSLSKELQERDLKIEELSLAYQRLQNEFELMNSMSQSQQIHSHNHEFLKNQDMANSLTRDQSTHHSAEVDLLRRQQKSYSDKEKLYKDQIADLKQQISRRYMAEKTEERKTSQRELQLEKKLKNMEEELNKARIQLDHDYKIQEAKRIKTAEELSLWEKQKKWQQTAEKLKKELKEKCEDYKKLNVNHEKLKSVLSCMEREKWYLRSKLKSEYGSSSTSGLFPKSNFNYKLVEDLQAECQSLRDRVSELTNRLESEDNHELILQIEKQKQRIAALEAVTEGNSFVVDQLEKLEAIKSTLEKSNIHLETENFELRMRIEKLNIDTPRLKEKVQHLEKYIELLKIEKSSDSSSRSSDKEQDNHGSKKTVLELEKTIFILKRIVEKLQAENKRLRLNSKNNNRLSKPLSSSLSKTNINNDNITYKKQYEQAKKRVVALETDLQLAEQRILMLKTTPREDDDSDEIKLLQQQLSHKSELLDRVKQLLTRAAINEKALRQQIQQIEIRQTLSTIAESNPPSPHNE